GAKAKKIHQCMVGVYGDGAPHYSTVAKWYSEFKRGHESLEDDPGLDAQQKWAPQKIAQVEALIMQDRRIKTDATVTKLGISHGSILKIIHDHLGMSKVSARWVPRNLSDQDWYQQMESSHELLEIFYTNQTNFLAHVVTGDETWIHHWDPKTKQESMQWKHQASPPPNQMLASKVMASIFWDAKGVPLTDYMPHKTRITGEYYASLMWKLRQAIKEKKQGVLLLHGNAPVHKAHVAQATIHEYGFEQLNHPPYSPDLDPSDYYLFQHLKAYLCGKRFSNDEELMEATKAWLQEQSKDFYFAGIDSLRDKWSKCIEVKGDYIEN
uniref:Mos1 transposase HTH domain-containing protein n=1 Tax=Latimeria chalumnae TaxID=7897 RepID=H3BBU0_LATCH